MQKGTLQIKKSLLILEPLESRILLSGLGDDHGDYTWNATPVLPGEADSGNIANYGFDVDMFSFYAKAGYTYEIGAGAGTLGSTRLSLISSNGYSVFSSDSDYSPGGIATVSWIAPYGGTFYFKIDSAWYQTGSYIVALIETPPADDYGNSPQTAAYIPNKNVWYSGTIEIYGDTDCFGFYALAGYDYTIETATGTLTDTFLWLKDGSGNTITGDDNSGTGYGSKITWGAPSNGYYYAEVQPSYNGVDYDFSGTYSIKVTENYQPPETINPLEVGKVWIDEFENIYDRDYFSFYAQTDHEYYIRAASEGVWEEDTTDTTLTLLGKDGSTILEEDDDSGLGLSSSIVWTAPENGTYYLELKPYLDLSIPFNSGSYSLSVSDGPADWTFMVYIAGDNNLEDAIGPDVNEMIQGIFSSAQTEGFNSNVNVILQTDGWDDGFYYDDYWDDSTWRYILNPSYFGSDIGEQNMGNPYTLSDFVNWSMTDYPADHYGLVLWDHGGGFIGACVDDTSVDILSLSELKEASNLFINNLDVIGFDACLMSMVEVAYQFKDNADVFVASETSEPSDGWKYDEITYELLDNPTIDFVNLGQTIVSAYQNEYKGKFIYDNNIATTLAAFDLSKIDSLVEAIDEFANSYLTQASILDWYLFKEASIAPINVDSYYYNYCDLEKFMDLVLESAVNPELINAAKNVNDTLEDIRIAEWHDIDISGFGGISIYLPLVGEELDSDYTDANLAFLRDTSWDEFLEVFISGDYPQFVSIPAKGFTYTDADGSVVNVKLTNGEGTATFFGDITNAVQGKKGVEIYGQNLTLAAINLTSSTEKTGLTINTKGGSVEGTELGGISGGSLGTFNGKMVDLAGNIELSGSLGSIVVDDIFPYVWISTEEAAAKGTNIKADNIGEGVDFDITGIITKFQSMSFLDGYLWADSIGHVKVVQGDFGVDVWAMTGDILGISVLGDITDDISAEGFIMKIASKAGNITGSIRAGSNIASVQSLNLDGAIISAGGNIIKAAFKGDILDSYILAGYDVGIDNAFGPLYSSGQDTCYGGDVLSVTANGTFARSYISAGVLPDTALIRSANLKLPLPLYGTSGTIKKVIFGDIDCFNATEEFGLFAISEIKPVKIGKENITEKGYFSINYVG